MSSHTLPVLILLQLLSASAGAQLYDDQRGIMGGGGWQGCDPSLVVEFEEELSGYLTYRFIPFVTNGNTIPYSNVWSVYDGLSFEQYFTDTLTRSFQGPGENLICLTVNAFDLITQQPCSTTTCRLVNILQDTSCSALSVDFELADAQASSITFQDISTFNGELVERTWSFGDGSTGQGAAPSHTYYSSGPFEVCLSVSGPPPIGCTGTVCKWLYLGPVPVPCEQVFEPGFIMVQQEGLVGVLDTSITSGMNYSINWDFGDGSPTEQGRFATHSYAYAGAFQLCSTVRTWGPLLADTCTTTLCREVFVNVLSVADGSEDPVQLFASPNPVPDRLFVSVLPEGIGELVLFDAVGRMVLRHAVTGRGTYVLDLQSLPGGAYALRLNSSRSRHSLRIIKE